MQWESFQYPAMIHYLKLIWNILLLLANEVASTMKLCSYSMLMLAVSAESWFVESPLARPHKHRDTHTMTQRRLCGFIKVHEQQERKGKAPQKCDWCLCPYLCPSSSALFPSVCPMPVPPPPFSGLPICHYSHWHQTRPSVSPHHLLQAYFFQNCLEFHPKCTGDPNSWMNKRRPW